MGLCQTHHFFFHFDKGADDKAKSALETELRSTKNSLTAMESQARSQQQRFDQLLQENQSLRDQLKDFDMLLGASDKKKSE
jgi:hypothetical protein